MAISAITSITYDKSEYSRYYRYSANGDDYSIINATVAARDEVIGVEVAAPSN